MSSRWYIYSKKADFQAIGERFGIDQVTARILRNRDITDDDEIGLFLHGTLAELYDEKLLPDIGRAASAVLDAVRTGCRIRIVGDYDIDGVCATYILLRGLETVGADADWRIPDRIRDGYGINSRIVEEAAADGIGMILTCDNGIAAVEELKMAAGAGIRTVVTDHHSVRLDENGADLLPPAEAVVDVKRQGSLYPTTEICGAVTAWKLIKVLYERLGLSLSAWLEFLEFAAIATVGDIMPLTGENRIIVKEGLRILGGAPHPDGSGCRGTHSTGLRTLLKNLGLEGRNIDAYHIGFILGPCINAGGRLESADTALRLFLTGDAGEAERLADRLIVLNEERKYMTEKGVKEGLEIIASRYRDDRVLVVLLPELHESLAGIVAGRIKDFYNRPAIVVTRGREGLKGSGRSIESYDMFGALCGASDLLTKFGGHKMAAGLSLEESALDSFRRRLNDSADLDGEDLVKKIWIDAAMPFGYISERLIREFESLAPFGQGFERPVFAARDVRVSGLRVLGRQSNVLRLRLTDGYGCGMDGIMFGEADQYCAELTQAGRADILYYPRINEYNGRKSIQLEIRDYRIS